MIHKNRGNRRKTDWAKAIRKQRITHEQNIRLLDILEKAKFIVHALYAQPKPTTALISREVLLTAVIPVDLPEHICAMAKRTGRFQIRKRSISSNISLVNNFCNC